MPNMASGEKKWAAAVRTARMFGTAGSAFASASTCSLIDQAKRPAPAQPETLDARPGRGARQQRKFDADRLARSDRRPAVGRRRQQLADIAFGLEASAEAAGRQRQIHRQRVGVADVQHGRQMDGPLERPQGRRQNGVGAGQQHGRAEERQADRPQPLVDQHRQQGDGNAGAEQRHRAEGRADHRGAGTCSRICAHDLVGVETLDLGARRQHEAVAQGRRRQHLDVVGDDVVAAAQRRVRASPTTPACWRRAARRRTAATDARASPARYRRCSRRCRPTGGHSRWPRASPSDRREWRRPRRRTGPASAWSCDGRAGARSRAPRRGWDRPAHA